MCKWRLSGKVSPWREDMRWSYWIFTLALLSFSLPNRVLWNLSQSERPIQSRYVTLLQLVNYWSANGIVMAFCEKIFRRVHSSFEEPLILDRGGGVLPHDRQKLFPKSNALCIVCFNRKHIFIIKNKDYWECHIVVKSSLSTQYPVLTWLW